MTDLPLDKVLGFLKRVPPFFQLPEEELKELVKTLLIDYFPRGEVILSPGRQEAFLYLVFSGVGHCFSDNGSGKRTLRYVAEEDHFGSEIMLKGECTYTTQVEEDMICYLLRPDVFQDLLQRFEDFEQYFQVIFDPLSVQISTDLDGSRRDVSGKPWRDRMIASQFETPIQVLVTREPVCCPSGTTTSDIARKMGTEGVGSVLVVDDDRPAGIVTKNDLVHRVLAVRRSGDVTAAEIMSRNIISMDYQGSCFEAAMRMLEGRCHHMVATKDDRVFGVISQHDLILLQGANPVAVVAGVDKQKDISGLKKCVKDMSVVQQVLLAEGAGVEEIWALMTTFRDRLTRRLLVLGIEALRKQGKEPPVVEFCWITFGTPGRKETLLRENFLEGFIYKDPEEDREEAAIAYMKQLALRVREGLLECGLLHKRNGQVLCLTESRWKQHMMTLVEGKTPVNSDNLRMFDFRGVPEDREFINDFRAHVMKDVARRKEFLARVRERNNRDAVPLCFYGDKVVTARGHNRTLALRQEVLTPLTDAVRCLALEKGIMAFGTTQRLEALAEAGVFKAQTAADLANAYTWLARMSLQRAFEAESGLDWIIDPRHCTSDEKRLLTECFHVIRECVGLAS